MAKTEQFLLGSFGYLGAEKLQWEIDALARKIFTPTQDKYKSDEKPKLRILSLVNPDKPQTLAVLRAGTHPWPAYEGVAHTYEPETESHKLIFERHTNRGINCDTGCGRITYSLGRIAAFSCADKMRCKYKHQSTAYELLSVGLKRFTNVENRQDPVQSPIAAAVLANMHTDGAHPSLDPVLNEIITAFQDKDPNLTELTFARQKVMLGRATLL